MSELITNLDNLIVGNNYLIFSPQDTVGRIEVISKYKGNDPDGVTLIFEPLFIRENHDKTSLLSKWKPSTNYSRLVEKVSRIPEMRIYGRETKDVDNIDTLYIVHSLGPAGQMVSSETPPSSIPDLVLLLQSIQRQTPLSEDVTNHLSGFLGGRRKSRRRKTITRKSKTRKSRRRKTKTRKSRRRVR